MIKSIFVSGGEGKTRPKERAVPTKQPAKKK